MERIGIIGGSFNPIHKGHVAIAKAAYEQYHLSSVIFVPNYMPGYKNNEGMEDKESRALMVKLAISDYDYFSVDDYEVLKDEFTYSYMSLQHFKEIYNDKELYFIMGADSLFSFESWKRPETICCLASILVAVRDDKDLTDIKQKAKELEKVYASSSFNLIKCDKFNYSSTHIRDYISKTGYNFDFLIENEHLGIDEKVFEYMKENKLFIQKHKS